MRIGVVIAAMVAVALCLVHLRHGRTRAACEIHRLQAEQISIRRKLWDQEMHIQELTAPDRLRRRTQEMGVSLVEKSSVPEAWARLRPQRDEVTQ